MFGARVNTGPNLMKKLQELPPWLMTVAILVSVLLLFLYASFAARWI